MSMSVGGSHGGAMSDINITPLIDVLLVLLIIFMVIVPVTPNGLNALVPQPPKHQQQQVNNRTVVVQIFHQANGIPTLKINDTAVTFGNLYDQLQAIMATRAEKVMFIRGDPQLSFDTVAKVINIAHEAGADHIGLITPKVEAGQ